MIKDLTYLDRYRNKLLFKTMYLIGGSVEFCNKSIILLLYFASFV